MIQEILIYLTEKPLLKEARAFGHLYESISLVSKEKRCQRAWSPHRHECQQFISKHLSRGLGHKAVLILGSGPLHEIPIELLAKTFEKVVLVDIVHLKDTKKNTAHLKNVQFIEHDITELEEDLRLKKILTPKTPSRFLDEEWDLVLSVNLMSQLPLHFESFIQKKMPKRFSEEALRDYLLKLSANHLAYLHLFKAPTLLITDTETSYLDTQEKVIQVDRNYDHLCLPLPLHSWIWRVAPIPEFQKDVEVRMKVCGFLLNSSK